jgi:hypothetical protein
LIDVIPDRGDLTPGQVRVYSGNVVEAIMRQCLDLTDVPINGRYKINFDAYRSGTYFEIKSVREAGKIPLYDFRLKKERDAGVPLLYLFGVHRSKGMGTVIDILNGMTSTMRVVYCLTLGEVRGLVNEYPLKSIKTEGGAGYQREGYRDGYRILPIYRVHQKCHRMLGTYAGKYFGLDCGVTVFCSSQSVTQMRKVMTSD